MARSNKPVIFFAFANDKQEEGRYLRSLTQERNLVEEALKSAQKAELCEVVVRTDVRVEDILNTFQDEEYRDRIAIFHFGGHADGYQLLMESMSGGQVIAHGGGLVSFLGGQKGLKLIFFNGCSTQQQAEELVSNGVPLVIGTTQSIPDVQAYQLSSRFYKGIGSGISIERAWKEATDEVKILGGSTEGADRSIGRKKPKKEGDHFPWRMYRHPGAESVKAWNLPDAGDNPLFGLDLPKSYYLKAPDEPFRGLHRFEEEHAAVFFGRGTEIRTLYESINGIFPIILYFGQSGVGKSSLLAAGLEPRIQDTFQVKYVRRDQTIGLLGSLKHALEEMAADTAKGPDKEATGSDITQLLEEITWLEGELSRLAKAPKNARIQSFVDQMHARLIGLRDQVSALPPILQQWKQVESNPPLKENRKPSDPVAKPLLLILDQIEEAFTKPQEETTTKSELQELMEALKDLFSNPEVQPLGKIILAFRKEFQAEIEKALQNYLLPYTKVFLATLEEKGIKEAVRGLTLHPEIKQKYQLTVEEELPDLVSGKLMKDQHGTVAPVLQILLKKMWEESQNGGKRSFSVDLFRKFEDRLWLNDFLEEKIEYLKQLEETPDSPLFNQNVIKSGLLLDLLNQLITPLGTAANCLKEDIRSLYPHRKVAIDSLIAELKNQTILVEYPGEEGQILRLTHDTLAPLVRFQYEHSDWPGQRTSRILRNKVRSQLNLSQQELDIIEKGINGYKILSDEEQQILQSSRVSSLVTNAENLAKENPLKSLKLATFAWKKYKDDRALGLLHKLMHKANVNGLDADEAPPSTIIAEAPYFLSGQFSANGKYFLIGGSKIAEVYNFKARESIASLSDDLPTMSLDNIAFFHPDNVHIWIAMSKGIYIWNWNNGRAIELEEIKEIVVYDTIFTPDGQLAFVIHERGIITYQTSSNPPKMLWETGKKANIGRGAIFQFFPSCVYVANGNYLITNASSNEAGNYVLQLWEIGEKGLVLIEKITAHTNWINSLRLSPDGQFLASASIDGIIKIWQLDVHKNPLKIKLSESLSPFEKETNKRKSNLDKAEAFHPHSATKVCFHPTGKYLASAYINGQIRLWELNNKEGAELKAIQAGELPVWDVAFSPDGEFLLSVEFGDKESHAVLWDLRSFFWQQLSKDIQKDQLAEITITEY